MQSLHDGGPSGIGLVAGWWLTLWVCCIGGERVTPTVPNYHIIGSGIAAADVGVVAWS